MRTTVADAKAPCPPNGSTGIAPSVGNKGDSHDNALAETINGLYKAETIAALAGPVFLI